VIQGHLRVGPGCGPTSGGYDREIGSCCSAIRASEHAHYPDDVTLTGIDLSEQMLVIARDRADELGRKVELRQGNAHQLPFDDAVFDTVVCTFGLCAIPDLDAAVAEMIRVLRPGGRLILVDHVVSPSRVGRGVQRLIEAVTIPLGGEHLRRRPLTKLRHTELEVEERERFKAGIVERLVARKPATA
jgi:ubiquinone/menaquinone biosynthesis C-methylase UbiE